MIITPRKYEFRIMFEGLSRNFELDYVFREITISDETGACVTCTMGSSKEVYNALEQMFGKTNDNVVIFMEIYDHLDVEGKFNMMDNRG
jgi:hypothetical protein